MREASLQQTGSVAATLTLKLTPRARSRDEEGFGWLKTAAWLDRPLFFFLSSKSPVSSHLNKSPAVMFPGSFRELISPTDQEGSGWEELGLPGTRC